MKKQEYRERIEYRKKNSKNKEDLFVAVGFFGAFLFSISLLISILMADPLDVKDLVITSIVMGLISLAQFISYYNSNQEKIIILEKIKGGK
jgi:lipid-A-disaccharide synthase-like uncharacterized protein